MSNQDVDKLLKAIESINGIVSVGEKVFKDGKVNWADTVHVPELYKAVEELVSAAKEYKEIGEEIKDIDGAEAIQLVSKLFK